MVKFVDNYLLLVIPRKEVYIETVCELIRIPSSEN